MIAAKDYAAAAKGGRLTTNAVSWNLGGSSCARVLVRTPTAVSGI
jgi:hypothetical protein